jgi:hypothetical protein
MITAVGFAPQLTCQDDVMTTGACRSGQVRRLKSNSQCNTLVTTFIMHTPCSLYGDTLIHHMHLEGQRLELRRA